MFALLAMAGDLGGSIGPAVVGRVTQCAGDDIRAGMGVGLIFPVVLDWIRALSPNDIARQVANTHTIFAIFAARSLSPSSKASFMAL